MKTARLSDVRHRGGQGAVDNFRVPESRIVPTATPFDESMPQVGQVDGDPPSASDPQHPAARLVPSAGFFLFDACECDAATDADGRGLRESGARQMIAK